MYESSFWAGLSGGGSSGLDSVSMPAMLGV